MATDTQKLRDIPISDILGIEINGRYVVVNCPFHSDRTPSLCIYNDNSYYCFGCKEHGKGAIDFLLSYGMSFEESIRELEKFIS